MSTPTTPSAQSTPQYAPISSAFRGRIFWHELMTPDVEASKKFYGAVFDWTFHEHPGSQPPYTIYSYNGVGRGGMMAFMDDMKGKGIPPHWMTYIGAPDVDAMTQQVVEMGGKVAHGPDDIPNVGRFSVVQDPQGAYFVLMSPRGPEDTSNEMAPVGDVSWHELWTTDNVAALEFYTKLLGWESSGEFDMGPMGVYRIFGRNGLQLGGMANLSPEMANVPPNWLPYFRVADVEAIVARVKDNGGTVQMDKMEVPGGDWVAMFVDAQGGHFAVHQTRE